MLSKPIPIVDLFAGPGGLGEGFSSVSDGNKFEIVVSAEMTTCAVNTLRLRAFYRILRNKAPELLTGYYKYCAGEKIDLTEGSFASFWKEAENEARQLTLGVPQDNKALDDILDSAKISPTKPWVLIGGPPCQAYSLVGRARNKGKLDYVAEDDHRHYLYKEYLRIIQERQPVAFIMENVKGILSSSVNGKLIFHSILKDLSDPDLAIKKTSGTGYRIYSLVKDTVFEKGADPEKIKPQDFVVKAENYGLPQARHRVILFGVREGITATPEILTLADALTVNEVIGDLPELRSSITKEEDSASAWQEKLKHHVKKLYDATLVREDLKDLNYVLNELKNKDLKSLDCGRLSSPIQSDKPELKVLNGWYEDKNLLSLLNHEARGHMTSDLLRYLYTSTYGKAYGHSPKGHENFDLDGLRPAHKNWESGHFSDRFRVQIGDRPSTTITSHISKDGHYFIHPDPAQCRSLTVREAARLQTFPDNYFFLGNRTEQFHQVGNAVPPYLAKQIGSVVLKLLEENETLCA